MRVSVDPLRCEANAVCVSLAPAVFALDDEDELQVLVEDVPPEARDAVLDAVASCPKQALVAAPAR